MKRILVVFALVTVVVFALVTACGRQGSARPPFREAHGEDAERWVVTAFGVRGLNAPTAVASYELVDPAYYWAYVYFRGRLDHPAQGFAHIASLPQSLERRVACRGSAPSWYVTAGSSARVWRIEGPDGTTQVLHYADGWLYGCGRFSSNGKEGWPFPEWLHEK